MKNTSEKIDTKILNDKFSDSQCLRGEQHDLTINFYAKSNNFTNYCINSRL
jgi:hypothetical protein